MKKITAFLLCILMAFASVSCHTNNDDAGISSTDSTDHIAESEDLEKDSAEDTLDEQNERAWQAFCAVIKNEELMYYPVRNHSAPEECYFNKIWTAKNNPTGQAMVDMDQDGIKELILEYYQVGRLIILHYKDGRVYGRDVSRESMNPIYTDGSFAWKHESGRFGKEYGISRISFPNGKPKNQELCRVENDAAYYLNGVRVAPAEYKDYIESTVRTPVTFEPFTIILPTSATEKALALASEYWGIKDGDFDPETGYRYRVVVQMENDPGFQISLYCFTSNSYYEHLAIAFVNIDTGEVTVEEYPEGK